MSLSTRNASTDEQEEAIRQLEQWADDAEFRLSYGTTIGKSPQTLIMDHKHQDGFAYIDDEGEIKIKGEVIRTEKDFLKVIENL